MTLYIVEVETTTIETYYVEAETLDEASETWSDYHMFKSECEAVNEVTITQYMEG